MIVIGAPVRVAVDLPCIKFLRRQGLRHLSPYHRRDRDPSNRCAQTSGKSIAIVHDWCPAFRGGERVLAELCQLFEDADVFTLFDFLPDKIKAEHFPGVTFQTSIANRLPKVEKYYRSLFFACPFLIEQFDVTGYDAVITSSAAFARGVLTRPDQPHLCYVHSPIRYAWDEQFSYLEQGRPWLWTQRAAVPLSASQNEDMGCPHRARAGYHVGQLQLCACAHPAHIWPRRTGRVPTRRTRRDAICRAKGRLLHNGVIPRAIQAY